MWKSADEIRARLLGGAYMALLYAGKIKIVKKNKASTASQFQEAPK
jgi:hypothetical protein